MSRKGVIFYDDGVHRHGVRLIKGFLEHSGGGIILHFPYPPRFAPSEYPLFQELQKYLNGLRQQSSEKFQIYLDSYFSSKPK